MGRSNDVGPRTAFIEAGSFWKTGYVEGFNGSMRDGLLNAEVFNTLLEARLLIEQWCVHHNTVRPRSPLDYRRPAPEVIVKDVPTPSGRSGPTGAHSTPVAVLHQHSARTTQLGLDTSGLRNLAGP